MNIDEYKRYVREESLLCRKSQALEYCEALIEFTEHIPPCPYSCEALPGDFCTCGLEELITQVRLTFASGDD